MTTTRVAHLLAVARTVWECSDLLTASHRASEVQRAVTALQNSPATRKGNK